MLSVSKYPKSYVDDCRRKTDGQIAAFPSALTPRFASGRSRFGELRPLAKAAACPRSQNQSVPEKM
jgi:hypothetical protein